MQLLLHVLSLICCFFVVKAILPSDTEHVEHVIRKRQAARIVDIGFTEEDYEADEDTGFIRVTLQVLEATTRPLLIRLIPSELNETIQDNPRRPTRATGGVDFKLEEISFPLQPSTMNRRLISVEIPIIPDRINEANQIFELRLVVEGNIPFVISRSTTLLRILDNDEVILIWKSSSYTFEETNVNSVFLIKAEGTETEIRLDVFIQVVQPPTGFAVTYVDDITFGGTSGPQRTGVREAINPDEQEKQINIVVRPDGKFEAVEEFLLRVSNVLDGAPFTSRINGTLLDTTEVFILDKITLGFVETSFNVSEDQGVVDLCVAINASEAALDRITVIERPIPLGIVITNGSAGAEDYIDNGSEQTLVIQQNVSTLDRCFIINITDDSVFEGNEDFTVTLILASNESYLQESVTLSPFIATIRIIDNDDSTIAIIVNDTVIGDPLLTVPINIVNLESENITSNLSLCFELHGESGRYFNLVSDQCVSVNAHYFGIDIFNIVDEVAVSAVDEMGVCRNIMVSLKQDECSVSLDGVDIDKMVMIDGISIRKYNSRVRISVPNCEDRQLVMWIFCLNQTLQGYNKDNVLVTMDARMMKFVIARGFNLQETSHGILGQFWNIPLTVQRYNGLLSNGMVAESFFNVTVIPPVSPPRSFPGFLWSVAWEYPITGEQQPCLYAGTKNAGPTSEIADLPDSVIEGSYMDYIVNEPYGTDFKYNQFTGNCQV